MLEISIKAIKDDIDEEQLYKLKCKLLVVTEAHFGGQGLLIPKIVMNSYTIKKL